MIFLFIRNGLYKGIYDSLKPKKITNDLGYREKGSIAAFSSGVATVFSHSFETLSVRQIGDLGRPEKFQRIGNLNTLNNGLKMNVLKTMIYNGIIIWPYDVMKEKMYVTFGDVWPNKVVALGVATFVGMASTFIFDNIKTRQMYAFEDPKLNRLNYKGSFDCFFRALRHEGGFTFFAGILPMYLKLYVYSASVV